ncbi:ATP synthase E chain-domain-containing protein [Cokeromyces recurvatus]|uniref:ATP synthase E chain-domain-containing protein n=1 Tax=Cokeromyces recurvatus TaxID=90255 RepID=UPI00221F7B6A|nr:ATP synthase E chain-domain-containing protein [Cokeromyces recurvatus]KAI7898165.1 ATP synthase E chain-domain-containing protein [Cokeromyces recurvatus]
MVNSAVANVGRWSALAFGLFYGYTHNISLQKQAEQKKAEAEYHRKELLIEQARLAYAKKQAGVIKTDAAEVTFDIESPDFDLEKYLEQFEKESN